MEKITQHCISTKYKKKIFLLNFLNNGIYEFSKKEFLSLNNLDLKNIDTDFLVDNKIIVDEDFDYKFSNKTFNSIFKKSLSLKKSMKFMIMVTDHCNLNCEYCYLKGSLNRNSMDLETSKSTICFFKKIIKRKKNIDFKEVSVQLTGGEPLLNRKSLFFLIEEIRRISPEIKISITSSLTLDVDKEFVEFCNKNKVFVRTSFNLEKEGPLSRNFRSNNMNSNEVVLENIKKMIDYGYGFRVGIASLTEREKDTGLNLIKKISKTISQYGIDINRIYIDDSLVGVPTNNYCGFSCKKDNSVSVERIKNVYKDIDRNFTRNYKDVIKKIYMPFCCCVFRGGLVVSVFPNGKVSGFLAAYNSDDFIVGDVDDDLDEIENNFNKLKLEKAAWRWDEKCKNCPLLLRCFGSCLHRYHPANPEKPSETCNQELEIIKAKIIFKRLLSLMDDKKLSPITERKIL